MKNEVYEFGEDDKESETWWMLLTVFINSICVAILTKFFSEIVESIVKPENHSEDADFEDSMIAKTFWMSSFISFGGLLMLAYWDRSFAGINALMIFLIIFKQILLNLIEAGRPHRYYPKKFQAHRNKFKPHCRKYPEDYEQFVLR